MLLSQSWVHLSCLGKPNWLSEWATELHLPGSIAVPRSSGRPLPLPSAGLADLLPSPGGAFTARESSWSVCSSLGHCGTESRVNLCPGLGCPADWHRLLCTLLRPHLSSQRDRRLRLLGANMFSPWLPSWNCSLGLLFCWQKLPKTGAKSGCRLSI